MKKILLLACDPGGANTVAPLFTPLNNAGFQVKLFGKNSALDRYKIIGVSGVDISEFIAGSYFESVLNFVKTQGPDLVVTGTSAEDFTEKYIWKACEQLNIPSFAILDQWINYGIRFSKYKLSEIELYNKNKEHSFMPSKICVMDDYAKQKTVLEGIDFARVVVTGQPYFDWLASNIAINPNKQSDSSKTILFVSEPISQSCGKYLGYTEKTIFDELVKVLQKISSENNTKTNVLIKPHPREDSAYFERFMENNKFENLVFKVVQRSNFFELIQQADLICGMSSMALLEAIILKKNVVSIQIGLDKESPFILDILGILKSIKNNCDLYDKIKSVLIDKKSVQCDFKFVQNSIENVIAEIKREL
jgi:hypothetical protein